MVTSSKFEESNSNTIDVQFNEATSLDPVLFERFRKVIYEKSGITLNTSKMALVKARVGRRLRALKLRCEKEYLEFLLSDSSGQEMVHFLDAVSTNLTRFYREPQHFEHLGKQIEAWYTAGQRKFRIWCAASSTGEEPYTISFTVAQSTDLTKVDYRLLATDISTSVLATATAAQYSQRSVDSIPDAIRRQYMTTFDDAGELIYEVNPDIRSRVTFNRLNLSTPPFPMKGPMDAVLCRNVMIYFDNIVRRRLLMEIHRLLRPDGFLYIGLSETLNNLDVPFKLVQSGTYVKA